MKWELVKYKYGLKPHIYTVFCLTLRYAKPKTVRKAGKECQVLNAGPSWRGAKHFQRSSDAKAFLTLHWQDWREFDWSPLPRTEEFRGRL